MLGYFERFSFLHILSYNALLSSLTFRKHFDNDETVTFVIFLYPSTRWLLADSHKSRFDQTDAS